MMRSLALTFMVSPLLRAGFNVFGDSASTHPALELFPFERAHGKSSRSLNHEHLYPVKRFRLIG